MHISEYYHLNRTQPTLDFVDIDIKGDTRVFIDPHALRTLGTEWSEDCVALVQSYFKTVIAAIRQGKHHQARILLGYLREPNETHLGFSQNRAKGRAIGKESAIRVWQALSRSEAVKSGLLEDLEDTILLVEGIDCDIISDITTNIIREPLIRYSQDMSMYYGIPLQEGIISGHLWNPSTKDWYSTAVSLPKTPFGKLVLVPKLIVRKVMDYNSDEYFRDYIIEYLREVEIKANTELVHLLKNGTLRVTQKDIITKYGSGKQVNIKQTMSNPQLLEQYRADKGSYYIPPLDHLQIAEISNTPPPEWEELYQAVLDVQPGISNASQYEKVIADLLTALFYPALANIQVQNKIHEGRKRIDITFSNSARTGFFRWLSLHYPASHIFIECKNYSNDIGNPELDQMSGRFSPSRGVFGIIICRLFENKDLFIQRCRDTVNDKRGYIIPLDDNDLNILVEERKNSDKEYHFSLL